MQWLRQFDGLGNAASPYSLTSEIPSRSMRALPRSSAPLVGSTSSLITGLGISVFRFPDLDALTPEIWDRVLETNLRGPFLLSRAFAPELRRNKVRPHHKYFFARRHRAGGSSSTHAGQQGGVDSSHPLFGRRNGTRYDR